MTGFTTVKTMFPWVSRPIILADGSMLPRNFTFLAEQRGPKLFLGAHPAVQHATLFLHSYG